MLQQQQINSPYGGQVHHHKVVLQQYYNSIWVLTICSTNKLQYKAVTPLVDMNA